jgi:hypothetical protein
MDDHKDNRIEDAVQAWLSKHKYAKETKSQFANRHGVDYDTFRKRIQVIQTRISRAKKQNEAKKDLSWKDAQRELNKKPPDIISNLLFEYMTLSDYLGQYGVRLECLESTVPQPPKQRTLTMKLRNRDAVTNYNYEVCRCEKNALEKDCSSDSCPNASTGEICHALNCGLMVNHNIKCSNNWIMNVYPMSNCVPRREPEEALGIGLSTTKNITKGTVMGPYTGELKDITDEEGDKTYRAELDSFCVDALNKGNVLRYINHSCEPNCEFIKRQVHGIETLFVVSTDDIKKDEFLSIKYNKVLQDWDCKCGKCA